MITRLMIYLAGDDQPPTELTKLDVSSPPFAGETVLHDGRMFRIVGRAFEVIEPARSVLMATSAGHRLEMICSLLVVQLDGPPLAEALPVAGASLRISQ